MVVDDDDDDDDAYQQVGSWSTEAGLDIKDIVWPNESRVPPKVRNVVKNIFKILRNLRNIAWLNESRVLVKMGMG